MMDLFNTNTEEKSLLQRFIGNIDWMLLGALFYILIIGFLAVYSATLHYGNPGKFIFTQLLAMGIGLVGMLLLMSFNYQYYRSMMYPIFVVSLLLLLMVLFLGKTVNGTKGWFSLGFISFQPVEIAKLMYILVLAAFLDNNWREVKRWSTLFFALAFLMAHLMLILLQPDFGSTLSYFPVTLALLFVAGVEPLYLVGILLFGLIATGIPLMATFFKLQPDLLDAHPLLNWFVIATHGGFKAILFIVGVVLAIFIIWWLITQLRFANLSLAYPIALSFIIVMGAIGSVAVQKSLKEYQRKRLIVFVNPEVDPLGSGYNIIQSKIAIGSGRIFGKGLFSGTQSQLGFLPEQHTDFIFAVVGEETGYLFSQALILCYFVLVWRALVIARDSRDRYGSLVATGLATMYAFYAIINIGMVMGMMPATGLPLPLVSYGGSSMVTSLWGLGLLFSIHTRRFTNQ
jgi:rod shape determining protein RodA